MFLKSIQIGAALACAAALLAACSRPLPSPEPLRSVKLLTVGLEDMTASAEFAGEVRARVESRLGFRVAGKLVRRQAEPGQRVRAGDVLAQLDPQDYQLAADAGRAQLAAAATNRDLAAADFKRFKELREQNFISGAELERREANLRAAQAQFEQAQAQLAGQGNQTAYTRLLADVTGLVTAVDAEVGQVVAAGAPVLRIAQDGPRDVLFSVPEDRVTAIKIGSEVEVRSWSGGATFKGRVREVGASADPITRTFGIKVAIDGASAPPLGSTVSVLPKALERSGATVIKLPTSAFRQDGQTAAVWVLEAATMTVRLQPVQIATADGNDVVVAAGLQPGMQVVVAGVHVLSPGQKVTVYQQKPAQAPAAVAK
ncbi:resistance-nodulation-cell division (RND) efflux membrane fusion protein [Comamonadaceae bacterium]|nr:resistance-nodulation-cell division (RND) efflux membrane fusion protein [Comamonadaceae bacterium]